MTIMTSVSYACYNGEHEHCDKELPDCICPCHGECPECGCYGHSRPHSVIQLCDCPGGFKTIYPGWKEEA